VEFLRGLTTRLSIYFHLEIELTLVTLLAPTFRQFVSGLSQPSHLMLFKIEPLRGISLLEINPALGLTMTDRLMGGSGQAVVANRALSHIEAALLDQIAQFIAEEWCRYFSALSPQKPPSPILPTLPGEGGVGGEGEVSRSRWQELRPVLLGHETDPRYLQTSPPESSTLVATIKARLGECVGQVQLAFPFATLEPLIQKLRAELKPVSDASPESAAPKRASWNPVFDGVEISIAAELPGPQLAAGEISRLKVGSPREVERQGPLLASGAFTSRGEPREINAPWTRAEWAAALSRSEVLNLPVDSADHVQLRLAGLPRLSGRLGKRNDHWAVEVSEILKP